MHDGRRASTPDRCDCRRDSLFEFARECDLEVRRFVPDIANGCCAVAGDRAQPEQIGAYLKTVAFIEPETSPLRFHLDRCKLPTSVKVDLEDIIRRSAYSERWIAYDHRRSCACIGGHDESASALCHREAGAAAETRNHEGNRESQK
jgi:hypothetical protein